MNKVPLVRKTIVLYITCKKFTYWSYSTLVSLLGLSPKKCKKYCHSPVALYIVDVQYFWSSPRSIRTWLMQNWPRVGEIKPSFVSTQKDIICQAIAIAWTNRKFGAAYSSKKLGNIHARVYWCEQPKQKSTPQTDTTRCGSSASPLLKDVGDTN